MHRILPLVSVLIACVDPAGPPEAEVRLRVDVSGQEDPPIEEMTPATWVLEGVVTSLDFEAQAHTLAGSREPTRGITLLTDDDVTVSASLEVMVDGEDVDQRADLEIGEAVTVTLTRVTPFWVEHALLIEDGDGFVAAAVEGDLVELHGLAGRLDVQSDETGPRTFSHSCGRGRPLRLAFTGDGPDSVSVLPNTSESLVVDGEPTLAFNVGSWAEVEGGRVNCADWSAPWRWSAWRQ